jgi:ABC-type Fe3+-hydroxamate transport system substrate-binding protein
MDRMSARRGGCVGRCDLPGLTGLHPVHPAHPVILSDLPSRPSPSAAPRRARTRLAAAAALLLLGAPAAAQPVAAVDALGETVRLPRPVRRVVSVVPSATDLLVAMGAAGVVVGRTEYDTAAAVRAAASVGGGLDPSVERIVALRPDLVIAWPEPSAARVRDALRAAGVPVYAAGLRDTAALYATLDGLGALAGRAPAAAALAAGLRARLDGVRRRVAARRAAAPRAAAPAVLYVASERPPYVAGAGTYVMQLVGLAGGRAAFPELAGDWPQLSVEAVVARDPDVLLLARGAGAEPTARLRALPAGAGCAPCARARGGARRRGGHAPGAAPGRRGRGARARVRGRARPEARPRPSGGPRASVAARRRPGGGADCGKRGPAARPRAPLPVPMLPLSRLLRAARVRAGLLRAGLTLGALAAPAAGRAQFPAPLYEPPPANVETRWASPENPTGARGAAGRANGGRKGAPTVPVPAGRSVVLAEARGTSGTVRRIWMTFATAGRACCARSGSTSTGTAPRRPP